MSFGFSVGDFIAVGNLAWQVYKSCKDAPESFKNVSQEVLSLHAVLKEIEETLSGHPLSQAKDARLATVTKGCQDILQGLQSLVLKYESLGSQTKRTWDRLRWHSDDIAELRARLTSNTVLLTAYINTSQVVIERQLNKFMQEYKEGKYEPSVITTKTVESLSMDEKQMWRTIRKELEDIGISVAAFDANKGFILGWFREAIYNGAFEEQALEDDSSSISCEGNLRQSLEDHDSTASEDVAQEILPQPSLESNATEFRSNLSQKVTQKAIPHQFLESNEPEIRSNSPQIVAQNALLPQSKDAEPLDTNQHGTEDTPTQLRQKYEPPAPIRPSKVHVRATPQKHISPLRRKRPPRVAALVSWVLRHEKALHRVVEEGDEATVRKLLSEKGVDADSRNTRQETPLFLAAKYGKESIVRLLLLHGVNVDSKDIVNRTPIFWPAAKGYTVIVKLLLENGSNASSRAKDKDTPLHLAARSGRQDIVRMLLEEGVDANSKGGEIFTPMHWAAKEGYEDVARVLLEYGAGATSMNTYGLTPLHTAAVQGQEGVVRLLLANGVDVDAKTMHNNTPLCYAAGYGHKDIVSLLLEKGADPDGRGYRNRTPLSMAAVKGRAAIVKILIEKGAHVNSQSLLGHTPLHDAAGAGNENIVRILLERGARMIPDHMYMTPQHLARARGYTEVVRLLEEYDGDKSPN